VGKSARDRVDFVDYAYPENSAAKAAGSLALHYLVAAAHTPGNALAAREQNEHLQPGSTIRSAGTDNRVLLAIAKR